MFANHPEVAREFASKTKSIKSLPEHKKPKKTEMARQALKSMVY